VVIEGEIRQPRACRSSWRTPPRFTAICHETLAIEAGAHVDGLLKHENFRPKAGTGFADPDAARSFESAEAKDDEMAPLPRFGTAVAV
jgi:hypothetical protein